MLVNARSYGESWASQPVLKRYQNRRMTDNFVMQSGMDLFYAGFSNNLQPLRIMRNLGLMAAERAGVLKRQALEVCVRVVARVVPDGATLIRPTSHVGLVSLAITRR